MIGRYIDTIECAVVPLGAGMDVILGATWLEQYDPHIRWRTGIVEFKAHGRKHRFHAHCERPEPLNCDVLCTAAQVERMIDREQVDDMWLLYVEADDTGWQLCARADVTPGNPGDAHAKADGPAGKNAATVLHSGNPGVHVDSFNVPAGVPQKFVVLSQATELEYLQQHLDVLIDGGPPQLAPYRDQNFEFDPIPGMDPPRMAPYRMSGAELLELRKQLQDLIDKQFIYPCHSPFASPVLFVRKKVPHDAPPGTKPAMRLCIDYRQLNKICKISKWPIPHPQTCFDACLGKVWFSRLDLAAGYHQVRIAPGHEKFTAMTTPVGQFCWRVLPFGVAAGPSFFCSEMSRVFQGLEMSDDGDSVLILFLDDILVASKTLEGHKQMLNQVFDRLRTHHYYAKRSKCEFFKHSVEFLGHVLSSEGLSMEQTKVACLRAWERPRSLAALRSFLGAANYYKKFVRSFSHIAAPLHALMKKDVPFVWTMACEQAFLQLKDALCSAPVLRQPDDSKPFVIYCDASDYATGAVLMQEFDGKLHPLAYDSRSLSDAERRYATHDKEMLAVMRALRVWQVYLRDSDVTVHSDHHSLQYFLKKDIQFNPRQVRWMEQLAAFPRIKIVYVKGTANVVADALSRHALSLQVAHLHGVALDTADPAGSVELASLIAGVPTVDGACAIGTTVPDEPLSLCAVQYADAVDELCIYAMTTGLHSALRADFVAAYPTDAEATAALADMLVNPDTTPWCKQQELLFRRVGESTVDADKPWMHQDNLKIYVPVSLRQTVMAEHHNTPFAGHLGRDKTIERVQRNFWWPRLTADIAAYVRTCPTCQQTKSRSNRPSAGAGPPMGHCGD